MSGRMVLMAVTVWFGGVAVGDGQTIQLPTFRYFTVTTTVSVPDRGSAYLGGVGRASSGSVSRGIPGLGKFPGAGPLFKNRGIGTSRSTSGVHVTATIIDHREIDEAVLGSGLGLTDRGAGRFAQSGSAEQRAQFLSRHVARNDTGATTSARSDSAMSVAEVGRRLEQAQQRRDEQAVGFLQRGRQLEEAGKANIAKIYYRMATRQATGSVRENAQAHLSRLEAVSAPSRLAARRP